MSVKCNNYHASIDRCYLVKTTGKSNFLVSGEKMMLIIFRQLQEVRGARNNQEIQEKSVQLFHGLRS